MAYRVGIVGGDVDMDGGSVHGDLRLRELVDRGCEWDALDEQEPDERLAEYDALYLTGGRRVDRAVLRVAPRLRHVARFGAGYDAIDVEACTAAGVVVTTIPGAVRRPLAMAGLTLILAVTHNLVQKHRLVEREAWEQTRHWQGGHTDGSRVAIIGFGSVGAELGGMLTTLGFEVVGVNRRGAHPDADRLGIRMIGLDEALRADVVVLSAALTEQTRGMIGAAQLAKMRPDAVLVNIGRGGLIDQAALVDALRDGRLRGAGLDVFETEPVPLGDPLLSLPNVTLAPHALCWTRSFAAAAIDATNAAILAAASGQLPPGALNPAALDHPRWHRDDPLMAPSR
jgi:phosphoglycerate dehydrogenase-like enzyme